MKVALVTTPPSIRSGIGDYTRHLLEHLRGLAQVELYVEPGREGETCLGLPMRSAAELDPGGVDQIVFQLGNEIAHAFMTPLVRRLGGTVVLHDWVLFDQAVAAHPELARGGARGHLAALREGGVEQALVYARNRREKRAARSEARAGGPGLLAGWHAKEAPGRWTADQALVRLPGPGARALRVSVWSEPGRTLRLLQGRRTCLEHAFTRERREAELECEIDPAGEAMLLLETTGIRASEEQRRHGDPRRLGTFVRALAWRAADGWRELDLAAAPLAAAPAVDLARDRFRLPLNRSIVRGADAFLAHSEFVRRRILAERGAPAPVGVVLHGADARWRDEDRRVERARLELPPDFRTGFLLTSFGVVQAHKRVDVLLEALALARRERPDVRLALVGTLEPAVFDPRPAIERLGLGDVVHCTGWVGEETGWRWIHAGDLAVQLRGPSTGGSSGGVFQSLSLGRGVIATDLDEQSELPDACVLKVKPGANEVAELARLLVALRDDPARRAALESAARAFVADACAWPKVAARYVEQLERFPAPRAARRGAHATARGRS